MTAALVISNLILWVVVLLLLFAVFALARQIGVLHERVAPVGALTPASGPKIGEQLESVAVKTLGSKTVEVGAPGEVSTFIFFMSPGCPICRSLLPIVADMANKEKVQVLYASDGDDVAVHETYAREHGIDPDRYVLSQTLGMILGVNRLPFAALINEQGVLRSRGLVNNREHLESLLAADELDVSSVQEYLGLKED
jgi:methylamine dehydrogenase accessory protein MauD